MAIFNHRETGKCAIFTFPYSVKTQNQDDPCLFRIRKASDLPDFQFPLTDVHMIDIYETQGKRGLYAYLCAFFMDGYFSEKDPEKKKKIKIEARKAEKDFWLLICPSGFPNRYVKGFRKFDKNGNLIKIDHSRLTVF